MAAAGEKRFFEAFSRITAASAHREKCAERALPSRSFPFQAATKGRKIHTRRGRVPPSIRPKLLPSARDAWISPEKRFHRPCRPFSAFFIASAEKWTPPAGTEEEEEEEGNWNLTLFAKEIITSTRAIFSLYISPPSGQNGTFFPSAEFEMRLLSLFTSRAPAGSGW